MKYLTPVLLLNNSLTCADGEEKLIIEKIKKASKNWMPENISTKLSECAMTSLGSRHSSISRTIIMCDGEWVDVSYETHVTLSSPKTAQKIDEDRIEYLERCIDVASKHIRILKNKLDEIKNKDHLSDYE